MLNRLYRMLAVGIAMTLAVEPGWGWGEVGHRVVGRIAAALLTPAAQQKVARILEVSNTKTAVANALADAAEWPDSVAREEFPFTSKWHFIDLGVKPNPVKDNPIWASPDTAFARIFKFFGTVRRNAPDELEPGSDLKFLTHLVGDVHQPLHAATNQDRGGNCLFLRFERDEGGQSGRTKFHSAWDTAILVDQLGSDDRAIARHLVRNFRTLTTAQQNDLVKPPLSGDGQVAIRAWIVESHDMAVNQLYGTLTDPVRVPAFESAEVRSDCSNSAPIFKTQTWKLNEAASETTAASIERQLMKAGVRLAILLNAAAL